MPDHITRKGYLRGNRGGRLMLAHVWVWEQAYGPIPDGYQIHHRDGDKRNNDLANLQLVTPTEHKRIHSPHYRRTDAGEWERRCGICGEWKPPDAGHYYLSREGWPLYGRCRPCHIGKVVRDKRERQRVR
jgi:hypothetical protein